MCGFDATTPRKFPKDKHLLLNCFAAADKLAAGVTYSPVHGITVLCDLAFDEMMLGCGLSVDEGAMNVVGCKRRVGPAEAARVVAMDDAARQEWLRNNPLVTSALEGMIMASDGSCFGHLGFEFTNSGGKWDEVTEQLVPFIQGTRLCEACVKWLYESGATLPEALARCGVEDAVECAGCKPEEHWTRRPCKQGGATRRLLVRDAWFDMGGAQGGMVRRSHQLQPARRSRSSWHELGKELERRVMGIRFNPEGVHWLKNIDRCLVNNRILVCGYYVGHHILWSRYYDACPERRAQVRIALTSESLRAKNAFSIEQAVERRSEQLQVAMLSSSERNSGAAPIICSLGPARSKPWRTNTAAMYSRPMGGVLEPTSNLWFYADRDLGVRVLKLWHNPSDTACVAAPSMAGQPIDVALVGSHLYVTDRQPNQPRLLMINVGPIKRRFSQAGGGR